MKTMRKTIKHVCDFASLETHGAGNKATKWWENLNGKYKII